MEKLKTSYLLKEFGINFTFSFFIIMFVFSFEGMFRILELLVSKIFSARTISTIFFISLSVILPYVLPLAFFCAITSLFTRLSSDKEILIFSAAGISPRVLLQKLLIVPVIFVIVLYYFNFNLSPAARFRKRTLIYESTFHNPLALFKEKTGIKMIPGASIYIEEIRKGYKFSNIVITYSDKDENIHFIKAKEGNARYLRNTNSIVFSLKNGFFVINQPKDMKTVSRMNFLTYDFPFQLPEQYKREIVPRLKEMTFSQIRKVKKNLAVYIELNKRSVFALGPIIFLFLGSGIGLRIKQKSKVLHFGIGAFVCVLFYELLILGEILSNKTAMPEWMWLPILVFGVIGWMLWA